MIRSKTTDVNAVLLLFVSAKYSLIFRYPRVALPIGASLGSEWEEAQGIYRNPQPTTMSTEMISLSLAMIQSAE